MRVTELVREARFDSRQLYSTREVRMAMKAIADPTRLLTISGGTAESRGELLEAMSTSMKLNKQWSLLPVDAVSLVGCKSAQKLIEALQALALGVPETPVLLVNGDSLPPKLLADFVRKQAHQAHGTWRVVVSGVDADKLVPANAPFHTISSIKVR